MLVFCYDSTFEGLLSAVFDAYNRKMFPEKLIIEGEPPPMFADNIHQVSTQKEKSERVWKALRKKLPYYVCNMLMHVWLSEEEGSDELIFRYVRKVFDSKQNVSMNFADPDIIDVKKLALKVSGEGGYLRRFIRFQKGGDGTYFAPVAPKYNALPLTINYLEDRFADQKWLVYDTKRRYGYYYDLKKTIEVTIEDDEHLLGGKLDSTLMAEDEKMFQSMWKNYFKALAIKERINPKLQRQHMPRRFWKYLTEKQDD